MKKQTSYFKKALVVLMAMIMVFTYMPGMAWADGNSNAEAPESITVELASGLALEDGTLIADVGDEFQFIAKDQNGNTADVKWSVPSYAPGTIDKETGVFKVTSPQSPGSTSYLYVTATSKVDSSVTKQQQFLMRGYKFSPGNKNLTASLSADGQKETSISFSGGVEGHNTWTHTADETIAKLTQDPGKGTQIKFIAYRPGTFEVNVKLDIGNNLEDTANITITGVAVEDADGKQGKTYLEKSTNEPNPKAQLKAWCAEGKKVTAWTSSDDSIAAVDANGLVTANGYGTALISAKDDDGKTGGIKVVVRDSEKPYFENIQFLSSAIKDYSNYKFKPEILEYELEISKYSTSTLTLQNTTLYDAGKYEAVAAYTDIDGDAKEVSVNVNKMTSLPGIPFGTSNIKIILSEKNSPEKKSIYTFKVTRPRDTGKAIKTSGGVVLQPEGRALLTTKYNGQAEGTLLKADENGTVTSGTGFDTSNNARIYLLQANKKFKLALKASTDYAHIRYSTDDGKAWTELPQGGGSTETITVSSSSNVAKVTIQILDDKTYTDNLAADKSGFAEGETTTYVVWVESINANTEAAEILTAECEDGDWYPEFNSNKYSYTITVPAETTEKNLIYTVGKDATVTLKNVEQKPDSEGKYTLPLTISAQTLTITSADGSMVNSYSFKMLKKKAGCPDKVIDFLCIGSQYTNGAGFGGYGIYPEATLAGSPKSLGNFGGYITYYYEDAIQNAPNNKYGIDFYVYGNAFADGGSAAEPGQVYVSKDNKTWYALAGSEHYEDKAIWDYTITYTKGTDGKAYWTDNQGNKIVKTVAKDWPSSQHYYLNDVPNQSSYSYTGLVLKSQEDNTITGTSNTTSWSAETKFGYSDYYRNSNPLGTDVNPYVEKPIQSNGFDISWAVDADGNPVELDDIHYIKVATASNIWAGSFCEKSTEVTAVMRTTPQSDAVGKTEAPTSIVITDGASKKVIKLSDKQQIYKLDLDDMKYISISVDGAGEADNIYVNNQRIAANGAAEGIKVTKEDGEKLVRVIVQNGDKEPLIYLLKLTSNAKKSDDLIDGIKIIAGGTSRTAATKDGKTYTASVGYRINEVSLIPIVDSDTAILINDAEKQETYKLSEGVNTFTVKATKDGKEQIVTLNITKESAPAKTGKINVYFTLLGDSIHGSDGQEHTLKKGGLEIWIKKTSYEVDAPATVLDVFEKALGSKYSFTNDGGNYISKINGLAEFTNGEYSGWMYTLNGTYPDFGVAEQTVKDGDAIVFHYTDNYHSEEASDRWNSGSAVAPAEDVKEVTSDAKAGTTTAPTEVKVSEKTNADGSKTKVAEVKVSADNQKEILKQAKEKKSNEIILVVSSKSVGDATRADVTLDKSFIDSIVKDTDAKLTIKTPFGDKTYTQEELKAMSDAATGSTVTVAIEKAEQPADDNAAKIEKAKSIVKEMKLVARSSKTAKKNVKAVLKNDAKVKASIKELKELGFTVKYRFYRSTKKSASYKSAVTKKTATYTNTVGKKGTKYFYKVQVRVNDENGKLVAKTELKQCKYATRTWTK